jgi:hypothetical protein
MEAKYQEIVLGERVCEKLKDIYFKDIPWVECHKQVADKLTHLKRIAKRFYVDKDRVEILKELVKYSEQDIVDAFNTISS